jgi:hypothetical protein
VLVFGLLVPAISALQIYWSANRRARPAIRPQDSEGELLGALGELGELTPTTAAMRTTLTVEEAAEMLEKLARKGHLQARTRGAVVLYGLWEPDRREPDQGRVAPTERVADRGKGSVGALGNEAPPPRTPTTRMRRGPRRRLWSNPLPNGRRRSSSSWLRDGRTARSPPTSS